LTLETTPLQPSTKPMAGSPENLSSRSVSRLQPLRDRLGA
jgi:hypothetical protein